MLNETFSVIFKHCVELQRFISPASRFELTMKAIDPSSMFFIVTNSKNARDKISRKYYTDFLYPFGLTKTVYYLPSSQSKIRKFPSYITDRWVTPSYFPASNFPGIVGAVYFLPFISQDRPTYFPIWPFISQGAVYFPGGRLFPKS